MSKLVEITDKNFKTEVLDSDRFVVVDFWAEWCPPCKAMSPIVDQLAETEAGIKFVKVNVDENSDLSQEFGIKSIPTFMVFKNGNVVGTKIGGMSKEKFTAFVMDITTVG